MVNTRKTSTSENAHKIYREIFAEGSEVEGRGGRREAIKMKNMCSDSRCSLSGRHAIVM